MRRTFLRQMVALTASAGMAPGASAQNPSGFPTRPLKLLVPFPPGGSVDPIARVIGQYTGLALGQPVVIENRPGANTGIAAAAVAKADPDGHTLLFTAALTHVVHTIQAARGYRFDDFEPIAGVSTAFYVMAVHPSVPVTTIPEFVAYVKANPGKLNFAISGIGNGNHLASELFNIKMGIQIPTVAYKGGGPALMDLLAGRVQVMITTTATLKPHIDAGALRPLAYTTPPPERAQMDTFARHGLREFEHFEQLNVILATKGTPAPIVARLSDAVRQAMEKTETRVGIQRAAQEPVFLDPAAVRARMAKDNEVITDLLRRANIKLD